MQLPPLNRISFNASSGELGRGFDEWLDSEPGQALLSEEKAMLTEWLRSQAGQRAVAIYAGGGIAAALANQHRAARFYRGEIAVAAGSVADREKQR